MLNEGGKFPDNADKFWEGPWMFTEPPANPWDDLPEWAFLPDHIPSRGSRNKEAPVPVHQCNYCRMEVMGREIHWILLKTPSALVVLKVFPYCLRCCPSCKKHNPHHPDNTDQGR